MALYFLSTYTVWTAFPFHAAVYRGNCGFLLHERSLSVHGKVQDIVPIAHHQPDHVPKKWQIWKHSESLLAIPPHKVPPGNWLHQRQVQIRDCDSFQLTTQPTCGIVSLGLDHQNCSRSLVASFKRKLLKNFSQREVTCLVEGLSPLVHLFVSENQSREVRKHP